MKPVRMSVALLVVGVGVASSGCAPTPIEADDVGNSETAGDGDGDGDGDGEPGDGDGEPGDGDGEPGDGDGDGDGEPGDGDGDGDGDPAECGNGEVERGEACDDGNDVDEDECTNACALPTCGDGIVSAGIGETCDDGNTASGDGCTATCVLPGALISEGVIDVGEQTADVGHEVVIDSADNIAVLLESNAAMRLAEYDPALAPVWNFAGLTAENPTLAIGPADELVLGGRVGNQGSTRKYDSDGNQIWTRNVAAANSWIFSVAVDGQGVVVAAGFQPGGGNDDALIIQYDAMGATGWSVVEDNSGAYGPITVDASGQVWALRESPLQLENFAADGTPGWTSEALPDDDYHELAADAEGNVYVLASAGDLSLFRLHKLDNTGALVWTVDHDDADVLDLATGLTLLPGGAILVAGSTNGAPNQSDGLLSWYDGDGNLLHELVLDGMADEDLDFFTDVAVSPGGTHAVAVGGRREAGGDGNLWIYKFEI